MKVLILHPSLEVYGGAELAIVKLSNYLVSKNHEVTISTLGVSDKVKEDLDMNKVEIVSARTFEGIKKYVHENFGEYDIINSHNHPAETLLFPFIHPHVWNFNELPEYVLWGSCLSFFDRNCVIKTVDRIIVFSEFNKRIVKEFYGMDSCVVPFGVDLDFFDRSKANPEKVQEDLGISDDDFVIVHPGWMSPFKNQFRTLLMYFRLRDKIPNMKIVFTGMTNTRYAELISDTVRQHKLKDIIIDNRIGRDILRDLYARSNVVVLPYRQQGGFLSAFQAMAMECNVIVSPKAPFVDLVTKHDLALVTDAFETTVYNLYRGETELPKNREWIKKNLTWENYGSKVESILKEVIE